MNLRRRALRDETALLRRRWSRRRTRQRGFRGQRRASVRRRAASSCRGASGGVSRGVRPVRPVASSRLRRRSLRRRRWWRRRPTRLRKRSAARGFGRCGRRLVRFLALATPCPSGGGDAAFAGVFLRLICSAAGVAAAVGSVGSDGSSRSNGSSKSKRSSKKLGDSSAVCGGGTSRRSGLSVAGERVEVGGGVRDSRPRGRLRRRRQAKVTGQRVPVGRRRRRGPRRRPRFGRGERLGNGGRRGRRSLRLWQIYP